jgi:hypothetical protein
MSRAARALLGHTDEAMTARYSVVRLDERRRAAQAVTNLLTETEDQTEAALPGLGRGKKNASDFATKAPVGIKAGV